MNIVLNIAENSQVQSFHVIKEREKYSVIYVYFFIVPDIFPLLGRLQHSNSNKFEIGEVERISGK